MDRRPNYKNNMDERKDIKPDIRPTPMDITDGAVVDKHRRSSGRCRRRRSQRKHKSCRCSSRRRSRRRRRKSMPLSGNPFIIFYLRMYFKSSGGKRVTEIARKAGRKWCALSDKERQKYIRLAERVRRRCGRRRKRH